MSDLLHLWMQALSDEGEPMLVSVESTDKLDNSNLAVDCPDEEFRTIEASLCQELHRTIANEPLRNVQQTKGQERFEAWRAIVRRYDQRNMSDKRFSNERNLSTRQDEECGAIRRHLVDVHQRDDQIR